MTRAPALPAAVSRPGLPLLSALAAAWLVLFHPLLAGRTLGLHVVGPLAAPPGARGMVDIEAAMLPFAHENALAFAAGRIPLWNDAGGAGAPFLGNQQSASLHPFTLAAQLVPWRFALVVGAVLKFLLAWLGTWLLARDLGLDVPAAALAACAFATSGSLVTWLCFPVGTVLCHLPLVVALARRAGRSGRIGALAACLASTILAGHLEYAPVLWVIALAAGVGQTGLRPGRVARLLLACAIGAAIGMAMVLPSLEYLTTSARLAGRIGERAQPPAGVAELRSVIDFRTFDPVRDARVNGPRMTRRGVLYFGAAGLLLAALGGGDARGRRLLVLLGLAAVLLWGNPVSRALWGLPLLSLMEPRRLVVVAALLLSLLAGFGCQWLGRRLPRAARMVPVGLVALLLVERLVAIGGFNPWIAPRELFPEISLLAEARAAAGHDRVVGTGRNLFPNAAGIYGLRDVRLYDGIGARGYVESLGSDFFGIPARAPSFATRQAAGRVVILPERDLASGCTGCAPLCCDDGMCAVVDPRARPRARFAEPDARGTVAFERDEPHRLVLDVGVDDARARRVVLADLDFPGWRATLDGRRVAIVPGGPFRAVDVPPGRHRLEMRYLPASFRVGLFLSLAGAAALAALTVTPPR